MRLLEMPSKINNLAGCTSGIHQYVKHSKKIREPWIDIINIFDAACVELNKRGKKKQCNCKKSKRNTEIVCFVYFLQLQKALFVGVESLSKDKFHTATDRINYVCHATENHAIEGVYTDDF